MSINVIKDNNQLQIEYSSEIPNNSALYEKIYKRESYNINKTFYVCIDDLVSSQKDDIKSKIKELQIDEFISYIESEICILTFVIGTLEDNYYKISKDILGIENDIFIHKDINIDNKYFVCSPNISIFSSISELIDGDIYITTDNLEDCTKDNYIPNSIYLELINKFPNSTEINKYKQSRISSILSEYVNTKGDFQAKYDKYISKKTPIKLTTTLESKYIEDLKYEALNTLITVIEHNLNVFKLEDEKQWQKLLLPVVTFINPKYIYATAEEKLGKIHGHDRQVDFVLIDASGYVDLAEIKSPVKKPLRKTLYRNNYIGSGELTGSIVQIEKYITALRENSKEKNDLIQRIKDDINDEHIENIKVVNPKGIIILGRSNDFTPQQKDDFELIKRQYNNVVDILTYDDLLDRLKIMQSHLLKETSDNDEI